ncbi:MAG: uL13 family ribosomal protein, partial [Armatimonadetes bacterium]|nr:uL13 family ribosomal protein [Armatimonadota bacterium]
LPRNKLLKNRLKRLKIYLEGSHPHKAQIPEVLEIK